MRTFAQKPKATRQTKSAKSMHPARVLSGQSREVRSILRLQRSIGSHAVQGVHSYLQTESAHSDGLKETEAPPIVHEVLRSPGQPLNQGTRASLSPHFGHNFSQVRVHTDAKASASALSVNALAYTVGQHIVFGKGRYAPHTPSGNRLLAHELIHTIQQHNAPNYHYGKPLEIGATRDRREAEAKAAAVSVDAYGINHRPHPRGGVALRLQRYPHETTDVELVPVSPHESERLREEGIELPTFSSLTSPGTGGSPYSTVLPGYGQAGDTCGASSLVTALIIWDREHWNAAQPNSRVVNACNLILIELARHGRAAIRRWADHPAPAIIRNCSGERSCVEQEYNNVLQELTADLQRIRDTVRQPGATVSEGDYQTLGVALYFLWQEGGQAGLSSNQIQEIQRSVGLYVQERGASSNIQSFEDIFTHSIIIALQPGQIAQVTWIVTRGQHAFLLGRLQSGEWFLSDQGYTPAREFRASTVGDLRNSVHQAATTGSYWMFVGTHSDLLSQGSVIPGWTGVMRLGAHTAIETQAENLVSPGAFLGEVDAGYTTVGNRLTRDTFAAQRYSLSDAQAQFPISTNGGGLIVEMPRGVYTLYTTSAVSDANLSQTVLDAVDSRGGVLANQTFYHAWLRLGTDYGRHGTWFSVY